MERDGSAESIGKIARRLRAVHILDNDGQVAHRERKRLGHEEKQHQREAERQCECAPIPDNLSQLFAALRQNSSHVCFP